VTAAGEFGDVAAEFGACGFAMFRPVVGGVFRLAEVGVCLREALIAAAARTSVSRVRAAVVSATQAPTADASKIGRSAGWPVGRRRPWRSAGRPNSGSFSGDGSVTEPGAGRFVIRFSGSPGAGLASAAPEPAPTEVLPVPVTSAPAPGEADPASTPAAPTPAPSPTGDPAPVESATREAGEEPEDAGTRDAASEDPAIGDPAAAEGPAEAPTGVMVVAAPDTGAAGIGMADPRPEEEDEEEEDEDGGQVSAGGRDLGWESARVRGRCVPACRPPPVRLRGSGAPMACIRSGTWLGSTT
jgi:hypothetical protein